MGGSKRSKERIWGEYNRLSDFIAVERHYDHNMEGKHLIGTGLSFRGLAYCCHSGKHSDTQADVVLEKELRLLHLDHQASGRCDTGPGLSF